MSHHGHDDEMRDFHRDSDAAQSLTVAKKLGSAVQLIQLLASGCDEFSPQSRCDSWLENNGYECEASRRRQRERRADQLDAEIARLRAEREKL